MLFKCRLDNLMPYKSRDDLEHDVLSSRSSFDQLLKTAVKVQVVPTENQPKFEGHWLDPRGPNENL